MLIRVSGYQVPIDYLLRVRFLIRLRRDLIRIGEAIDPHRRLGCIDRHVRLRPVTQLRIERTLRVVRLTVTRIRQDRTGDLGVTHHIDRRESVLAPSGQNIDGGFRRHVCLRTANVDCADYKRNRNNDGFLDTPIGHSFIGLNRWKYIGADGLMMQFGIKGTFTNNYGGQMNFDPENDALTTNYWGMRLNVNRYEGWAKIGKVFLDKTWKTFGFQFSGIKHQQKSYFGLNQYDADQHSFYANFLYQSIIGNTNHKFRTGASFQYDNYSELLNESVYNRNEIVPGVYFEYTVKASEKLSAVAGIRFDYHNNFGAFLTPRLHVRYAISDNLVIRASGGRGERTASIIAENIGLLASSRQIIIQGDESDKPYGLKQEVAWNYGINITQSFRLAYRDGSIGFDFYRTQFENQIVVDVDQSPQTALFYNLDGQSFSNSFQAQVDYELIKRLDVRLAYRWFDVRTTYHENLLQKPLIAINRAFINLAYETRNHWKFDLTINWQGQKRIPFTNSNPPEYQLAEQSPDFVVINTQISKSWNENFEVYLGAENLFNYKQENPILSADKPFSPYFDASLIWGPVFGRNIYAGLRYKIK